MEVNDIRRQHILTAAINRFAHFGVGKTSMTEIAKDVNLSKANLYYYFHDKMDVVAAIIELLIHEGEQALNEQQTEDLTTEETLLKFLEIKILYFEKYRLLFQELSMVTGIGTRFEELAQEMMHKEIERISSIFEAGILRGELVTFDIAETSKLYVSVMRGLTMCVLKPWQNPILDGRVLNGIFEQQKQVNHLFFNGIKNQNKQ